ncbi:MAG: hypothetical protein ACRCYO_08145, partial [Bacteroidia bacterium]
MSNSPGVGHILSIVISVISLIATIATQCNKKPITYKPFDTSLYNHYNGLNDDNVRVSDSSRLFVSISGELYKRLLPSKNKSQLQKLVNRKKVNAYSFEKQDDSTAVEKGKIGDDYTFEITQTVYSNCISYEFNMTKETEMLNVDKMNDWYVLLAEFMLQIDKNQVQQTRIAFENAGTAIQNRRSFALNPNEKQLPISFD